MRNKEAGAVLSLVLLCACAEGTPPARAARPDARGSEPSSGTARSLVLVEVTGTPSAADAFASRLEADLVALGIEVRNARASGAKALSLASAPGGPEAAAFRKGWPGDVHLLAAVSACEPNERRFSGSAPAEPGTESAVGARREVTMDSSSVECPVTVTLTSALDGHQVASFTVTGGSPYREYTEATLTTYGEGDKPGGVETGGRVLETRTARQQIPTGHDPVDAETDALTKAAKAAARRIARALRAAG
jgi:hypothetical protein